MSWLSQLLEKNSSDPRIRLELGEQILDQLSTNRLPSDAKSLNELCDVVYQWLAASNFKVSLQAVEILNSALDVSGDVLAPYLIERIPPLIERLGDSKVQVRDAVTGLLLDLAAVPYCSAQLVLEKISPGFGHKQWLVRTGTMSVYRLLLDENREQLEIQTNRLIPTLCKLMADPNVEVRETATATLVHVMVVLGENVATSIRNRRLVPDVKMAMLLQRYEEALRAGSVPSSAPRPSRPVRRFEARPASASRSEQQDQENRAARSQSTLNRPMSTVKKPMPTGIQKPAGLPPLPTGSRRSSLGTPAGGAGAVTEDELRKSFTAVPKVEIFSVRDIQTKLDDIRGILSNDGNDWNKRTNSLKLLRSVVLNGGMDFEPELVAGLMTLEEALIISVKDLRSQVCKEACTTLCFLTERLGQRLLKLWEAVLPICIALIQNSAKVMSTSGAQACEFIIRNIDHPKLIPIVTANMNHKSKEIRKKSFELIYQMLSSWCPTKLEKNLPQILEAVRVGVTDADSAARTSARQSFNQLEDIYPDQAARMRASFDLKTQKALAGGVSAASSSQSIASMKDSTPMGRRPNAYNRPNAFLSGRSASAIDSPALKKSFAPRAIGFNTPRGTGIRPNVVRSTTNTNLPPISRQSVPLKQSTMVNSANSLSQPGSRSTSPTRSLMAMRRNVAAPGRSSHGNSFDYSPQKAAPGGGGVRAGNGYGHSHSTDQQELFTAINNLSLNAKRDSDDDFLGLGITTSTTAAAPSSPMRFENAQLTVCLGKLALAASNQITDRKEGLKQLHDILRSGQRLSPMDAKKVSESLSKILAEGNHKLMSSLIDAICELSRTHHDLLAAWLPQLLAKLLTKSSIEILPTSQAQLATALQSVRGSFDPQLQLVTICHIIQDPIVTTTPKAKKAALVYLHELMTSMDPGCDLSSDEVRKAVSKIFVLFEDPRSSNVHPMCETVVYDLFSNNSAEFSFMLQSMSPQWKAYAYDILKKHGGLSSVPTASPGQRFVPASFASPQFRSPVSQDLDQADGASRFTPTRTVQPKDSGFMLGSVLGNGNGNHSNGSYQSPKVAHDMSYESEGGDGLKPIDLMETTQFIDDVEEQSKFINKLLANLSKEHTPETRVSQVEALMLMHQMMQEGSFTTWDEHFKRLLFTLLELLSSTDMQLRKHALRLLMKTCMAQAARFYDFAEMAVIKVLDSTTTSGDYAWLINIAEETLKTLATHLPMLVVLRTITPIIAMPEDVRISGCLKMMAKIVDNADEDELVPLLPDIVPGVVNSYTSTSSTVRKNCIFTLVTLVNKLGRPRMDEYLNGHMEVKGIKILELYITRAKNSSTNF